MTKPPPLVAAVVLNWNKAGESAHCVVALRGQTHPNLRVIVVDNGSPEDSLGPLHDLDAPFLLLRNGANLGFTGGVNTGIRRALSEGADFIWLVNNDAAPAPDALELMLRSFQADAGIGLASPTIRNGDAGDEVEFCGGLWEAGAFHTTDDAATYEHWRETRPRQIWLVGTALLLRRELVEAVGLFDDRFFAYWEDNDYSVRSIRAGYRNVVVPGAVVRHWSGLPKTDPGTKPPHYYYYMARNEIVFLRKHVPLRESLKPMAWAISRQAKQIKRLHAFPGSVDAVLCGLCDGLCGRGGAYHPGRGLSPAVMRPLRSVIEALCSR